MGKKHITMQYVNEQGDLDILHPATNFAQVEGLNERITGLKNEVDGEVTGLKTEVDSLKTYVDEKVSRVCSIEYGTLVVGTATSGHKAEEVDFLCTGTDDQVIINQAIAALPTTGGKILLREGEYQISGAIDLAHDGVTLSGIKGFTVLQNKTGHLVDESKPHNEADLYPPDDMIAIYGSLCRVENLTFRGYTLEAGYEGMYLPGYYAVAVYNGSYNVIENNYFNICGGIMLHYHSISGLILRNIFLDTTTSHNSYSPIHHNDGDQGSWVISGNTHANNYHKYING